MTSYVEDRVHTTASIALAKMLFGIRQSLIAADRANIRVGSRVRISGRNAILRDGLEAVVIQLSNGLAYVEVSGDEGTSALRATVLLEELELLREATP